MVAQPWVGPGSSSGVARSRLGKRLRRGISSSRGRRTPAAVATAGRAWGEAVIEARLGAEDMVLNQRGRPHGFRNDGVGPVLMSISVGSGAPKPPVYACHPRDNDGALARRFGAAPGRTIA